MRAARLALAAFLIAPPALAVGRVETDFPVSLRVEAETYRYRVLEVRFPSLLRSPFAPNNTVWGHLYLPRPAPRGGPPACVLVLTVMAAPNNWIEMRFVRELVLSHLAVMWLEMPYQFHRRPSPLIPSGQVFLARSADTLGKNFRQSVEDARRAAAWLGRCGLVDGGRVGIFGISLGAMVGASLVSTDGRPRAAVFALGGADFPDLIMRGSLTAKFVRKAGLRREELQKAWSGLDPLDHREENRGKRVLLINARADRVIPAENARKLKQAFPDSTQLWVPFGHLGAMLHLIWIPSYVSYRFLRLLR